MSKMQNIIRIIVTIETKIYRDGITQLLDNYSDIEVVSSTSCIQEAVEFCRTESPHILLLDASLPEALPTVRTLKGETPEIKIILLSMKACREQMMKFADKGVHEFVARDDSLEDLRQSITAAMMNGFWCSSRVAQLLLEQSSPGPQVSEPIADSSLTRQQVNVLQLLESGISNKEIARKLHIETATVKNHVHHILQKLQVHTRGEAAAVYRRHYHDVTPV